MAILLSGEIIAERILSRLERQKFQKKPKLVVVQVGEDLISATYIKEKEKAAQRIGVDFELLKLSKSSSYQKIQREVAKQGKLRTVSGIIVQLPLPSKLHTQEVLDAIPVEKDVDVLSSRSFGLYALGKLSVMPPTVKAISLLLKSHGITIQGKHVVLVGAGRLVGLPVAFWLFGEKATVSVVNEFTKNLSFLTKQADILISGAGKAKLIKVTMVKKGAVVIDAGTSVEKGRTTGDVDFNNVIHKVRAITPVPGGVGPLTVACLLENVVMLAERT
ncbi:bifunctional 5,10-methylenetetrahydrofolate dehydrogenase/5,10-methenyltetrahydrofolate cyclohydrolase [Patescibacteria group bacterium]|nr:bifunctional 5,10-methylenetetrahydrofolate dehydrogenase/5,10-methenyltetrahydrofolate cyclohydrolase [Patescibacteria group bacterium]